MSSPEPGKAYIVAYDWPRAMFVTLAITLAVAVAAGFAMRGRLGRLADLRFRLLPLLFASLVLGLLPVFADLSGGPARAVVAVANAGVLAFLVVNAREHRAAVRAGLAILLAGWLLNAIVIVANGGMPLSEWAYAESGQADPITAGEGGFFKIVVAGPDTALRPLGDVIPIEPLRQVLSVGDLFLILGIGVVVAAGMRREPSRDQTLPA